jgi:hypothetical protein
MAKCSSTFHPIRRHNLKISVYPIDFLLDRREPLGAAPGERGVGYVRKSEHKTGLTRKKKTATQ